MTVILLFMNNKDISLLYDAVKQGIIDMEQLNYVLKEMTERKYLEQHTGKIWQGKNEYWYTKIDGKLFKKRSKNDLEKAIVAYYRALEPELKPTFKEEFADWLESKKRYREVKDNTIMRYEDDYQRYFKGTSFENLRVEIIDDLILDEFIRETIRRKDLTSKAYSCFRTVIIGVLKHAKRKHHTSFSVSTFFKDFEISRNAFKKPSKKRKNVYKKSEREALYVYLMENPTIENLGLALMCLTGLRIGELAALKLEDNVASCQLYIHRTETRMSVDGKRVISVQDTAKMDHDGEIVLPKAAQRIIDIVRMRTHDDEYLFSDNGRRITAQCFRRHLKNACKAIGIEYRPPHQMRKTYASILLASGVDEAIVKKEMRHTDIATTRAYYQFITESSSEEKAIIDKVMGL